MIPLAATVRERVQALEPQLRAVRRDLHAHPELGREEVRTAGVIAGLLREAGLHPRPVAGTGLVCDLPGALERPAVLLRADLDALPLPDGCGRPWASTVAGVAHACGHDVHTTCLLGAGLALAGLALPAPVRLLFQPAEELLPGGALDVLAAGALDGVGSAFALHCDPKLEVGAVGLRAGALTAACDAVSVTLTGPGGHTSRPQLTADLIYALGRVITETPAALSRLVDPRAGLSLVWGAVSAGRAANAIPRSGTAAGTVRVLDDDVWQAAPELVSGVVRAVAAPYGVGVELDYRRGVPPVVNDAGAVACLADAVAGVGAVRVETTQSLGGEDFAWLAQRVPAAMARLGVTGPGMAGHDLHTSDFDVDEDALVIGAGVLALAALGR